MNTSGVIQWNRTFQVILIGLVVGGIVWFKISSGGGSVEIQADTMSASGTEGVKIEDVPIKHVKDLKVVVNGKTLTIAYREACPDKPLLDVLLLHGMAFKSQTWVSEPVFTVQQLYLGGYRAVAIDLPGFGDSPQASPDPAAFMEAVIQELKLNAPVIISPSMSGSYALPYLFNGKAEVTSRCRGYVPVAPVATEKYTAEQYKALKVPALVIYGENDKSIGPTSTKNLKTLPKRFMVELKGAGHACYMNKPVEFQTHLDTFLKSLL